MGDNIDGNINWIDGSSTWIDTRDRYSKWKAFFPMLPRETRAGEKVWLRKAYWRKVTNWTGSRTWIQYATIEELLADGS